MELTLTRLQRRPSSTSGNPAWHMTFDDGTELVTKADSMFGYEVTPGWEGRRFEVLASRGTVESMTEVDLNVWGTPRSRVGEGFCKDCERAEPGHYTNCPQHAENAPCRRGTVGCSAVHPVGSESCQTY